MIKRKTNEERRFKELNTVHRNEEQKSGVEQMIESSELKRCVQRIKRIPNVKNRKHEPFYWGIAAWYNESKHKFLLS